ncbi:hypothetical protein EMIHUDRAFT_211471 [Emiliania huxleyi CCMP1516]|uniref:EF-hand domain-containing protein n=3 Tax=Emiliania huxleyi TaxID=2903 RepID=A0A0D3IVN2_EMIH1|nr:hypothetical protein EMIHUDRAFT_211471 [Emiliania huxleyi CCMP1516]EOD15317.1 hypothetical protein EMIHUDRAFT_211471 [Emiliania huxleyi CCMP1516]|eukprot:XP_005767746.1 hypothetical protein EMIHUDRAFT_211471 [Emiliania huxleyi CCMP1516]
MLAAWQRIAEGFVSTTKRSLLQAASRLDSGWAAIAASLVAYAYATYLVWPAHRPGIPARPRRALQVAKRESSSRVHIAERVPRVTNPFGKRPLSFSKGDYLRMALCSVTLFPLRVAVLLVSLPVVGTLAVVATIGADETRPLGPARRAVIYPVRLLSRVALWCLGYWWVPVLKHPAALRERPRVLVAAPHYSLIDMFFLTYQEMPMALSKSAIAKIPIFGRVAKAMQSIFVDRQTAESRAKAAETIRARCREPGWPPLLVFPEGTTTNGAALIQFKAGAFGVGQPVQPVLLRYGHTPVDVSSAVRGYEIFLYAMLQPANSLTVEYLPPHAPTDEELADPRLFASNVRAAMAEALGVPCTGHSYEDAWLSLVAHEGGREVAQTFEVKQLAPILDLDTKGLCNLLRRFHAFDLNGSGTLNFEEFMSSSALELLDAGVAKAAGAARGAAGLMKGLFGHLKHGIARLRRQKHYQSRRRDSPYLHGWRGDNVSLVRRLFRLFDNDDSGEISFAELVQGLAVLSRKCDPLDQLKLAFITCDLDADGGVTLAALKRIVAYHSASRRRGAAPISELELEAAFAANDLDENHILDFDEFCTFLGRHSGLMNLVGEVAQKSLDHSPLAQFMTETKRMKGRVRKTSARNFSVAVSSKP